jgi:hypothetical protein
MNRMLTIQQHILHELQVNEPLNIKNLLTALKQKQIEITSIKLKQAIDKLISDGWVEYYELIDTTLGYELCNRWYNLEESKRNKILGE